MRYIKINPALLLLRVSWRLKSFRFLMIILENYFFYSFFPFKVATCSKEMFEKAIIDFKKTLCKKFEIIYTDSVNFDEYSDNKLIEFLLNITEKVIQSEYCYNSDGLDEIKDSPKTLVNYFDYVFNVLFICLSIDDNKEDIIEQLPTQRELSSESTELMAESYVEECLGFFLNRL